MLEVFAIIGLCKLNKRNAIARGRRPGGFIALTIVLWVVLEFIGMIVGMFVQEAVIGDVGSSGINFIAYIFAFGFAGIGALISFLCAKFGPKGDYVDPSLAQNSQYGAQPVVGTYNVPANTPAYMASSQPMQPVQPREYVHVENPYQAPAAAPVQQSTEYCEFCGEPLKPGAKFCASCGTKVEAPLGE